MDTMIMTLMEKMSVQNLNFIYFFMLGNFSCLYSRLLIFSKLTFSKNSFRNTIIRVSNGSDRDQNRCFVRPDLGSSCLQRLSADDKSCR